MLWIEWANVGVGYGMGRQAGRQVHFIDGIFNGERYDGEILRPIVVPYIQEESPNFAAG